jgi:hypothetical protein
MVGCRRQVRRHLGICFVELGRRFEELGRVYKDVKNRLLKKCVLLLT